VARRAGCAAADGIAALGPQAVVAAARTPQDGSWRCALELVERPVDRGGKECRRRLRGSGQQLGVRGVERAPRALPRIGRQRGRALQEGSRRSEAAAGLCAAG
jgi:hypothetical protein